METKDKECKACKLIKSVSNFYKHSKEKVKNTCKLCENKRKLEYYYKNRSKIRSYQNSKSPTYRKKERSKDVCGVYKITNIITNEFYIGSSLSINKRVKGHFRLSKYKHKKDVSKLQTLLKLRPSTEEYKIEILLVCDPKFRFYYENVAIFYYNPSLNTLGN